MYFGLSIDHSSRFIYRIFLIEGGVLLFFLLGISCLRADTLSESMAFAYTDSPLLESERANLRIQDEYVPQALSAMRPRIALNMDKGFSSNEMMPAAGNSSDLNPAGLSLTFSQVIFDGFRTAHTGKQQEQVVFAAREFLRSVEQGVLLDTVRAYAGVLRSRAELSLRIKDLELLKKRLELVQSQLATGVGTITDVSQAEAAVALSSSHLSKAYLEQDNAASFYEQTVGRSPKELVPPDIPTHLIPDSLDDAIAIALEQHPSILSVRYMEVAADYQIKASLSELSPNFSVEAGVSRRYDSMVAGDQVDTARIVGRITVPLYQAGYASSRVRQAKQLKAKRQLEGEMGRRRVRSDVVSAWGRYEAAQTYMRSTLVRINAERVSLNGTEQEREFGQRTFLDILNAQQSLLNAEVGYLNAQWEKIVSAYGLLAATGNLNAIALKLDVKIYDPALYYRNVESKFFGVSIPD